jgi:acetyl-CoA carboxylase biotin carboxyl carrier protein
MSMKDMKELGARLANGGKAKSQIAIDSAAIRELAELLAETGLTEIEIEQGGQKLRVARRTELVSVSHAGLPTLSEPVSSGRPAIADLPAPKREGPAAGTVTSPMVGTVYVAPEPGKPAFVKIGDAVKEGDTLLIVEAMKTMNPILAPRAGTVSEICIVDGQPIEFGQALVVLS